MRFSFSRCAALLSLIGALVYGEVRRQGQLDHLDAETLDYYLNPEAKSDYDVAVLFYAQWCRNCHALAPIWDQISRLIHAGTTDSKLVMGLFDCEADYDSMEACTKAGITHYPTIMFISKSGQNLQHKQPKNTIKFAGNWQYGDAVLDWLKTMSALSQWHRAGWGKRLRNLVFGRKPSAAEKALPVGVPKSTGGASPAVDSKKVGELEKSLEEMTETVLRSSTILDAMMFPIAVPNTTMINQGGKNFTDVFALMKDSWKSTAAVDQIVKTCSMEVSLDYCGRLNAQLTNEWIDSFANLEDITEESYRAFQVNLEADMKAAEPFCDIVEECIMTDFLEQKCRPETCPFEDPSACRYLTSCLTEQLQLEYAEALNLSLPSPQAAAEAASESASSSGGGAWGVKG